MKYLKRYEDFEQQEYTVGDLVKLSNGEIAKIKKIVATKSYIVNIMKNHEFMPKDVSVRGEDDGSIFIVDLIQSANSPAMGSDIVKKSLEQPSNDLVLNGDPGSPVANTVGF
jgi:hypothetical protein